MRFQQLCFAAVATLVLSGVASAAETEKDAKPDAERIVGTWILESSDRGESIFLNDGQSAEATFEESKFQFVVLKDGGKIFEFGGDYYLDDKQTPKTCDITLVGDGGANSIYAIYEFNDGKLRFRIRDNNGPRPADFDSQASDCQILTYRRKKAQ
ncbi:MAG: TIGR03067 domain-containing protein [Pirellulales bacterium]